MKTKLLLLLLLFSTLSYSQTLPTGHYGKFEFTNGNLNNGSSGGGPGLSGSSTTLGTDRNGFSNNALISTAQLAGHTLGASNYNSATLSFWIKNGSSSTSFRERIIQIYGAGGFGFKLEMNGGGFYLDAIATDSSGNFDQLLTSHANIGDNLWHHIVVRTSDSNQSIDIDVFIDGVLQSDMSGTIDPAGNMYITSFLRSAQMVVSPGSTYLGNIDDIYLYKSSLTDAEILDIYNYIPVINSSGRSYVNANATGNNDGTSWVDAYTNLQVAFGNVGPGDEIWIASGTYKPSTSSRNTYYVIDKADLKIYGGFAGTEGLLSDRIVGTNETILSGDLLANDVNDADFISSYSNTTRNADNSYHVINITEYGNNLLLEGITVSDAHNNLDAFESGGAIVKDSGVTKLTLKNCIIKDNVSRNGNAGLLAEYDLNGTGILGELNIENCIFSNNMARWATAIYSFVRDDTDANINITNSLFDGNIAGNLNSTTAQGYAGSSAWLRNLSISSSSTLNIEIINSTFVSNNDTGTEQNLNNFSSSTLAISRSNGNAGAINTTVANSIFWGNRATGGLTARSITDLYEQPPTSVNVLNSIDEANFNDAVITNTSNTTNSNPLFTDAANGDFTLTSGSPAVDTGDNSFVFESTDLLGNQRVFNTTVDMGAYEFGSVPLGINNFQLNDREVKLYPNPASSVLNIEMTQDFKQATIYSVLGKEVLSTQNKNINISGLSNGVFLIKIEDANGNVSTKRFIKQ